MESKKITPMMLARELGLSIINSVEFNALKNLEDEILNLDDKFCDENLLKAYLQAKKDYERLVRNVYNILECIIGESKLDNKCNKCCGKCNGRGCNHKK